MSKSVLPMFSSKSFITSGLIFQSLIYFKFLCMMLGDFPISFFTCSCLVFPAPLIEESAFSDCIFFFFCHLCHRLVDHRWVGLSPGFPLIYISVSRTVPYCFTVALYCRLKSGSRIPLGPFFFLEIAFAISSLLCP